MSESDLVEPKGIVIPYVGIDRIIELLSMLHKHGSKEKNLPELATLLGCTRSNLNNVTPSLGILGLAEVKHGSLILTLDGLEFAENCISDPERAKQVIKKNISKAESLMFVKSLLETRTSISGDEIGRALAERYKKNWKDMRTYRNFGNSCASILSYAGIGYFDDGVLSTKPPTIKASAPLYAPSIGYNPIIDLLKALHGFDRAKVDDLSKKVGANDSSVYGQLTVCSILRLVEKETSNTYRITEVGKQLIDPITSPEEKSGIFKKCLLGSPYAIIIHKLATSGRELTYGDIGDILGFFMKSAWSTETKLTFAKKFVTWLNGAQLAEKVKPGVYKVTLDAIEQVEPSEMHGAVESESAQMDINNLYEIGRAVGSLESIIIDGDKSAFFNNKLVFLKELLQNHQDLKIALDMLAKNFEMANSSNNPALYKQNLDFVRERIKEKVLKVTA